MMNRGRRWGFGSSLLVFILLILPSTGFPQAPTLMKYEPTREPIRIQADFITYDDSNKTYLAEGRVEIWQADRKLTSDQVVLNTETQEAEATGNVVLVQGNDFLRGERMKIALDTNLGIVIHGTLFLKRQNYYLRGEEIERVGENTYRIREATFTTCDGDWPAWRFTGKDSLVVLEESADIQGATFQIKNLPILYSPYLSLPLKTQRQSGFLPPRTGYSNLSGVFLGLSYFWAIAKNQDATFYLDTFTGKGVGEGLEYRYIRKEGSGGILNAYHIQESSAYRQKYTDPLDRGPERWLVDFAHDEYFTPTFFAKTRLRAFSDREYFKEYPSPPSSNVFSYSVESYSLLSLTKNWERYSFYGEGRKTVDLVQEDPTTLQYYPVTHLVGIQQPLLSTPLFFNFETSYGYFYREQGPTGYRVDLFPTVSLPLRWDGLEFKTALGGRETWYPGINDANENSWSRQLWNFNTSVATDIYRVYDTDSKSVPKLKHVIRPEIGYLYIPNVDQTKIPYYDVPVPQSNSVYYGFSSRLIGKVVEASGTRYHEYAYFKLAQQYNIQELSVPQNSISQVTLPLNPPIGQPQGFGLVNAELRLKTLRYLTVENITNYDPNLNVFQTSYTNLSLADRRGDALSVQYNWVKGAQEQLNGYLLLKIFPFLDFTFAKSLSLFDHTTLSTTYGLIYRHQCWSLQLTDTQTPAISGLPAQNKILFMFTLYGVTSVGQR
jgi:LPS-assembly protein